MRVPYNPVGISAWRGGLSFEELTVMADGTEWDVARHVDRRPPANQDQPQAKKTGTEKHTYRRAPDQELAKMQALRALCQVVLNLNEFVYVD